MIRALIFDCFGVFYPDPVFAYMQDPLTPPEKADALHALDEQAVRGKLSKKEFIQKAALLLNKPEDDIERQLFQRHSTNKQLVDFVKQARNTYKTALLSNVGRDIMDGFFTSDELRELFDEVILSGNEKFAKPDPEFFILACKRLGVMPEETILIDDVATYCEAAKSLGMQAICYQSFDQFSNEIHFLLQ